MISRSLAARLLVGLMAGQGLAILVAMLVFPLLAPFVSFDDMADYTFRNEVMRALRRDGSGALTVVGSPALSIYMAARPGARFAVYDVAAGQAAAGSDAALAADLARLQPFFPQPDGSLQTDLPGGKDVLIVNSIDTALGRLVFATAGNQFHLDDLPSVMIAWLPAVIPVYGPIIFGSLVLLPLVVRLVTRPLRRLSAEAAALDLVSFGRGLSDTGLGPELRQLVGSINQALERIANGLAKQRIYSANAAHELRTPVSILGLHVEDLPPSDAKTALEADVGRIRGLVEQLVMVARLGQNHVPMDETIDLVALSQAVIADRAPIALRQNRDIELDAAMASLPILGNGQALSSALANVLDNAIRAEPEGGLIRVVIDPTGRLDIVDHGIGVAPEHVELVFEPFWRRDQKPPGAGLGLAIVKEIVDRHGMTISVLTTPGGGATFRFDFSALAVR